MKFKVGDKARCINEENDYDTTIGNIYPIVEVDDIDICIIDDIGDKQFCKKENFELVQEDKLPHELLGLPHLWYIRVNKNDPLWDSFWKWYEEFYNYKWSSKWEYFGFDNDIELGVNASDDENYLKKKGAKLITLAERNGCVNKKPSQTKELLKPISQTYSIDGFTFIIGENGISIPGKHDERLWFKNSKKSVVKKFRQALNKFCDEMDI